MEKLPNSGTSSQSISKKLYAYMFCGIIEETLDQLFILRRISNYSKLQNSDLFPWINFPDKSKKEINKQVTERVKRNVETFNKNCDFVEKTLKSIYEELTDKGTYETLLKVVTVLNDSKRAEENIKEDTTRKQNELEKLEYILFEEKQQYLRKIADCMADIGKIKDEIEDFLTESEIKTDYIEHWLNSKIEMNAISLERIEEENMTKLKKLDGDIFKEARVHHEILSAYSEMKKDIKDEIAKWERKYDKDCKELDAKIQLLSEQREKQNERARNLKETYSKREKQMNDYKAHKIKVEAKKLELQKRNEAATKIQAWWRGTMVRKGFGKFRKKKDKKGKKKG